MIFSDVISGSTDAELVPINSNELIARLGKGFDLNSSLLLKNIANFDAAVSYRYSYVKVPFRSNDDICYFENVTVKSSALSYIMRDCEEAILLAVTAGISVDKLISKASIQNASEALCIDAISSAGVESYIDYINNVISEKYCLTKRFSPGYADFPLDFQAYLLNRVNAERIGISLTDGNLMIPMKSITAVIGVK